MEVPKKIAHGFWEVITWSLVDRRNFDIEKSVEHMKMKGARIFHVPLNFINCYLVAGLMMTP
jgi:hypothetical protein